MFRTNCHTVKTTKFSLFSDPCTVKANYFLEITDRDPHQVGCSEVDRHRSYADPDTTFRFDADPDSNPTPSVTYVGKKIMTFIHSNASLHRFIFLQHCH
jgi:hypothetical protein